MRKVYSLLAAGTIAFSVVGCGTVPVTAENHDKSTEENICGRLAADSVSKNDYSIMKGHLSQEMAKIMAEDKFQTLLKQLEKYGKIDSVSYVTTLRATPMRTEVWKISFSKKAKDGNMVFNDKLLHVTTCIIDGKERIFAMTIM